MLSCTVPFSGIVDAARLSGAMPDSTHETSASKNPAG